VAVDLVTVLASAVMAAFPVVVAAYPAMVATLPALVEGFSADEADAGAGQMLPKDTSAWADSATLCLTALSLMVFCSAALAVIIAVCCCLASDSLLLGCGC